MPPTNATVAALSQEYGVAEGTLYAWRKAAHEAAAYDKWFRAQVQEALDDPRPSIPNEAVQEHFAAKRKELKTD